MNSPLATPAASPRLSTTPSPTRSRASSRASHLTLDLSTLPEPKQPASPTNTLLITNLTNPHTFDPTSLLTLRSTIATHAPLASWSPLRSFRRIVCSFPTPADAALVRLALDGTSIYGDRARVYYGTETPVQPEDQHLQAPESKKLFFISPPPSPPHGWQVRDEGAPNSVVVAEDLAEALGRLSYKVEAMEGADGERKGRERSGSCVVLLEEEAGRPGVSVDDYSGGEEEVSPVEGRSGFERTSRPPVELMADS